MTPRMNERRDRPGAPQQVDVVVIDVEQCASAPAVVPAFTRMSTVPNA
jgi:hypothetical protein